MANLEVQIGADKSDFDKKIKEVEFDVKQLAKEKQAQIKLGLDTTLITSQIKDAKKSLNDLRSTAKDAGNAIGKDFAQKTGNGGNALMQFSRIAQDAPYGIIGIGNNITATVEAFGHLKNSTGSTGSALKAMASSIIGSGGILLAVSLVTTAFTYMAQNGLSVGDVYDKLTGNFDETKKSLSELGAEVAKTAGAEISSMKSLVSISQDDTKSRKDRITAVKELQDMYPAYFGNLSQEKILNGDLTQIVLSLSTAIKERARASALSGKAGEIASKELGIQEKLRSVYQEMFKILGLKDSSTQLAYINALNKEGLSLNVRRFNASKTMSANEVASIARLKDNYGELRDELKSVGAEMNHIQNLANRSAGASVKLLENPPKTGGGIKPPKPEKYKNPNPNFNGGTGFIGGGIVNPNLGLQTPDLGVDQAAIEANEKLKAGLKMQEQTLADFNQSASDIINSSISNTFAGLGNAIGGALASGGNVMKAAGNALLAGVGALLTNLGTMAIQVGVGLLGIKAALKTLNPAVAIGAGVALVALGAVFSSKASALGGGGSGGGGGRSVSTGASVSSPTSSTGSSGGSSFQGGTVVFEISGQSLIGVLGNTLDKNKRLGGSLSLG